MQVKTEEQSCKLGLEGLWASQELDEFCWMKRENNCFESLFLECGMCRLLFLLTVADSSSAFGFGFFSDFLLQDPNYDHCSIPLTTP